MSRGRARSVRSYYHGYPKRPFGRLLRETNHASLTNQCLTRPAMCTVPEPSPRPSHLHQLFQYDPAKGISGDINPLDFSNTIQSSDFMSDVTRRETVNPDTANKDQNERLYHTRPRPIARGVKLKSSYGYQIMAHLRIAELVSH